MASPATSPTTPVPVAVLPGVAVPHLSAVTRQLSRDDVAKISTVSDFAGRLRLWGYVGGWERTFQGESRRLTLVISRSLTFRDKAGADAFVRFVREHPGGFFPFALVKPLAVRGRSGWMFEPPECACHMANPYLIGLATMGAQVSWLEINGPGASGPVLRALFGELPESGPTAGRPMSAMG